MTTRTGVLRALAARLGRAERLVLVLLGVAGSVWLVAGAVAVVIVAPVLAAVLAVPTVVVAIAAAVLVGARLRRRRADRRHPQVGGPLGATVGHHPDTVGVVLDSAAPDRRRAAELLAERGSATQLLLAGQASRATLHRDALALRATRGRLDAASLLAVGPGAENDLDPIALVALARVVGASDDRPPGYVDLLVGAAELADAIPDADRVALVGLLIEVGAFDAARRLHAHPGRSSWGRTAATIDLRNPHLVDDGDTASWLAALNASFAATGLEPVALVGAADRPPFERLQAPDAAAGSVHGPLVSVVMTVHRPGPGTLRAVESVRAQTWADWELLVIDDASGSGFDATLDAVAALDARVRVVRADANAGTYVRRNDGIDLARGEYLTFHDSDDWSHPRRLETQVRALEGRPRSPGVVVTALRATDELGLWQHRGADLRLCEPSLMVRREHALAQAGFFDPVRRGGDVEYRERLGAASGAAVDFVRTAAPLVLMRADPSSLSGGDFAEGWAHPARVAYRSLHRRSRRRGDPLRRGRDAVLPYAAPDHLTGADRRHEHDLVLLADLADPRAARRDRRRIVELVTRARGAGLSVAVRAASSPLTASADRDLDARLLDAILDAGAELRVLGERIAARELVVVDPAVVLVFPDGVDDGAEVERVTVLPPGGRRRFPAPKKLVDAIVRERWGRDAVWADAPTLG